MTVVMANSVRWHGNALKREDGHALKMVLLFEVEDQSKKQGIWKRQVEEEHEGSLEHGRCALQVNCWH